MLAALVTTTTTHPADECAACADELRHAETMARVTGSRGCTSSRGGDDTDEHRATWSREGHYVNGRYIG